MRRLALTGATGFVGGATLEAALAAGWQLRALTRRAQPPRTGVEWISGSLEHTTALAALVDGVDAIIHVAGVVNAPDRAGFMAGNLAGTEAMLAAARAAGVRRLVHVSSLSAREPSLSVYGESKAAAEQAVRASDIDWTIIRPPAVYGPGDMEMRDLFRLAARGFALLPPGGRLSVIEVSDLARLLVAAAGSNAGSGAIWEPDDGTPGGWSHADFARAIGAAVGRSRVWTFAMPATVMRLAARADGLVRGGKAKLTLDRVAYFCHPDWVVSAGAQPPAALWTPAVDTPTGLAATARWYRAQGLL